MTTITKTSKAVSHAIHMRPSRSFYFPDGDTIISCRNRSYRVHSHLLAFYSVVMRKALNMGRLPRLWKRLEDKNLQGTTKVTKKACSQVTEKRRFGGAKLVRDIVYFISLDDSVRTIELLFYCIYYYSNKPRITLENLPELMHLSISYAIPTLLPLCINFLKSLTLFHPLTAIVAIRSLTNHRKTTPEIASILNPLYSEALTTILNDLPRYQDEQRKEEYTRVIPAEVQYVFSECWASYVERVEPLRSGEVLFGGGFTYPHSCKVEGACEGDTRANLLSAWSELWESCTRNVPRPCEISKFFMTVDQQVGCGGRGGLCRAQVKQALEKMLRDLGGEDAMWDWRFLAIEGRGLKEAKEMAIGRAKMNL